MTNSNAIKNEHGYLNAVVCGQHFENICCKIDI
jgi:hypothetical protein